MGRKNLNAPKLAQIAENEGIKMLTIQSVEREIKCLKERRIGFY